MSGIKLPLLLEKFTTNQLGICGTPALAGLAEDNDTFVGFVCGAHRDIEAQRHNITKITKAELSLYGSVGMLGISVATLAHPVADQTADAAFCAHSAGTFNPGGAAIDCTAIIGYNVADAAQVVRKADNVLDAARAVRGVVNAA
ncbi:MAG: hypothetical protein ACKV2O_08495 [Acidimicrobiales bacterium]